MTDDEILQQIAERDRIENLAAMQPPTFQELPSHVGRLATQRSIIQSEMFWGIGMGDPSFNPYSERKEA
jgi:hypothetical protein